MGYNFVTHRKISQKLITCNFERDVKKVQINKTTRVLILIKNNPQTTKCQY